MCVNCEWTDRTVQGATLVRDLATSTFLNSPRHTPDHRAAADLGAVIVLAVQGAFQAWRTGNPEPLARLAKMVEDWGRQELDKWPFQFYNPMTAETLPAGSTAVVKEYPDLQPADGQPVGTEALAERVRKLMVEHDLTTPDAGRPLTFRWLASRKPDGTFPGKITIAEAVGKMEAEDAVAKDLAGKLFGGVSGPTGFFHKPGKKETH